MPLTDQRLGDIKREAQALCDLCLIHGYRDGATAQKAVVEAISAEQAHRSRGGQPNGG
jgi:hypothetical protein